MHVFAVFPEQVVVGLHDDALVGKPRRVALERACVLVRMCRPGGTGKRRQLHHRIRVVNPAELTAAAQAGGTTRELMARAGHRTARAALIYQHAAEERGTLLAERMDAMSAPGWRVHNLTALS